MFKLVTIYRRVDDESKIDDFFSQTHLPLAEQLPGLIKTEVSRIVGKPQGESRFYFMYELYFISQESCFTAMQSETGRALALALKPWEEARIISWFYAATFAEEANAR
jgi:uncharacterized protein (TIGR02118 family)